MARLGQGIGVQFPTEERDVLFSAASRPVLRPTQPVVQCEPWALSPGVKPPGREADHHLVARLMCVELYRHSSVRLHS
jgi:hypothetical protein